ncbi:hypothetical protein VP01_664g9 [Puccinia sorghi]|uniref:Uncharacterized protein n=1 Tax=Puccinia sorghi TaxID=27349 RepID=A0A0L6UFU5_9BASI|nr:hypothetical protein VP01_664g9 [Puccinia sorghi]
MPQFLCPIINGRKLRALVERRAELNINPKEVAKGYHSISIPRTGERQFFSYFLSQAMGEMLSYELWDGGKMWKSIFSPEFPGWEMAPPCFLIDKCSHSIQWEEYMNHEEKFKSTGRIEELNPLIIGEEIVEDMEYGYRNVGDEGPIDKYKPMLVLEKLPSALSISYQ